MARPKLITVSGSYYRIDGTPESGTIQFRSNAFSLSSNDGSIVVPSPKDVVLDETGSFSVQLPATNDPDWTPVGWTYQVTLRLSQAFATFEVGIPFNSPSDAIRMSQLLPAIVAPALMYAPFSHEHPEYVATEDLQEAIGDSAQQVVEEIVDEAISTSLANYSLTTHTHAASDIVSGTIAAARLPIGVTSTSVAAGNHTHSEYALADHVHEGGSGNEPHAATHAANGSDPVTLDQSQITGLVTALNTLTTELGNKANLASPTFTGTVSGISKAMVGLANVDNTSDSTKNSATSTLTNKTLASPAFTGTPTGLTKTHVGLANVDNTSDANKPISSATQTALNGKAATVHTHAISEVTDLQAALDGKQASGSYALSTDVSALDGRVDTLEEITPTIMVWNGSSYVESTSARIYVGPNDPGVVPDGSLWIEVA